MKKVCAITVFALGAAMLFSCNSNEAAVEDGSINGPGTRVAGGLKNVVYVEVNDINPLNAGSYFFEDGQPYYDIVILFAANINGVGNEAVLHLNDNVTAVLSNVDKYVRPLQANGQKVILSILGNHTGLGFANLSDAQVESFAQKLAHVVDLYGLDGIDFDDEWAKYGENGYPSWNNTSYLKLVKRLRELMPDKLITVFDWGYAYTIGSEGAALIDYAWNGAFSQISMSTSSNINGLPVSKYAGMAYDAKTLSTIYNTYYTRNANTSRDGGYGAILTYDLRTTNIQTYLNRIGEGSVGMSVTYNNNSYPKDWVAGPTTDF